MLQAVIWIGIKQLLIVRILADGFQQSRNSEHLLKTVQQLKQAELVKLRTTVCHGINAEMLAMAVLVHLTGDIPNLVTLAGSGRLRSNQIAQAGLGLCISSTARWPTAARTTAAALSAVCARPWFLFGHFFVSLLERNILGLVLILNSFFWPFVALRQCSGVRVKRDIF
jgi:hypothetical protein